MSLDTVVWLVAGAGFGMGATLLLLVGYVSLERLRLGRRLGRAARARAVAVPSAPPVVIAATEPEPEKVSVAAPDEPVVIAPPAAAAADPDPVPETTPEPVPAVASEQPDTTPGASPDSAKTKSVEEIFAQAFAGDQFVQAAKDKPGFQKP